MGVNVINEPHLFKSSLEVLGRLIPSGGVGIETIWYVDAGAGEVAANGKSGTNWDDAFANMAEAFAVVQSGDTIVFRGNVKEQLSTPVGVFDVTIIGAGNRPRHAGYAGGTGDFWFGNFSDDVTSAEVDANGMTTSAPVA